jgi:hypothetical protein
MALMVVEQSAANPNIFEVAVAVSPACTVTQIVQRNDSGGWACTCMTYYTSSADFPGDKTRLWACAHILAAKEWVLKEGGGE